MNGGANWLFEVFLTGGVTFFLGEGDSEVPPLFDFLSKFCGLQNKNNRVF